MNEAEVLFAPTEPKIFSKKIEGPYDPVARLQRSWAGRFAKRLLHKARMLRVRRSVRHLYGPRNPQIAPGELIVLCLVRDGELYLRSFVEHHLRLGARYIVLLDNGSSDRTQEMAQSYKQVVLLQTLLPYNPYEWALRQYLVEQFARDRWSLSLDIDERFDYPFSDTLTLNSLLRYLDHHGYTAVVAYLLDRFAPGEIGNLVSTPDDNLEELYPLYDLTNIQRYPYHQFSPREWGNQVSNPNIAWYRNGIRESVFGADVSLTKQPLVYFGRGVLPRPTHHVRRARIADFTALIHHYKFLGNFRSYVERSVREQTFMYESLPYHHMLKVLQENPHIQLASNTARRLQSVDELIEAGFLVISPTFQEWCLLGR